jgi:4-amino-4-deoxy-L-arabinose transferase-like glycosyltransferase
MPQPEASAHHGGSPVRGAVPALPAAGGAEAETAAAGPAAPGGAAVAEAQAPGTAEAGRPRPGAGAHSGGPRRRGRGRWRLRSGWPLLVVLAVQAVLSLRLLRADTAFQDEATYLWAGHLEWAHWLHGAPVPPLAAYFSGAPVVYPPLGALADSAGGLAGARALSLVFMLGATALLWAAAGRLFGRRAAFFAAALFAVTGPVLHLGAFATYDALAVLLTALAAWCVIAAGPRGEGTGWMAAAGAALAVANAAAYASALFDLAVLALALLTALPAGARLAARRCATLLIVLMVLITAGLLAGGRPYLTGIGQTTLARATGPDSPPAVLAAAWPWAGLIVILAAAAIIISAATRQGATQTWLLTTLTAAALAAPAEQARLHTLDSLDKHLTLGIWFAAIAAGYTLDRFIAAARPGRAQALATGALTIALVYPAALGATQSRQLATAWPNATSFLAIFGPLAAHTSGNLLVEDAAIARYYLPAGRQWQRWSSTRNIIMPTGASTGGPTTGVTGDGNAGVYAEFITKGYFTLVALNYADTTTLDHQITTDLRNSHHYRLIAVIPYGTGFPPTGQGTYVIWRYEAHP